MIVSVVAGRLTETSTPPADVINSLLGTMLALSQLEANAVRIATAGGIDVLFHLIQFRHRGL